LCIQPKQILRLRSSGLMMEAAWCSEMSTSVYKTPRCHYAED
jgi:hypothetical protein